MENDLISRSAAISIIEDKQRYLCPAGCFGRHYVYGTDREKFDAWEEIIDQLDAIPAEETAPVVHGQWGGEGDGYAETEDGEMALVIDVWHCSKCGYCIDEGIDDETMLPNYCPNCGAKMDKEEA